MDHGTELNGFSDAPVRNDEHALVELNEVIRMFENAEYTIYTPSFIVDKLKRVSAFTTTERIEALKYLATETVARNKKDLDNATREAHHWQNATNSANWELKVARDQYSRLKQRFHEVKQENANLRLKVEEAQVLCEHLANESERSNS
jgi:chromosome segregation ATPase